MTFGKQNSRKVEFKHKQSCHGENKTAVENMNKASNCGLKTWNTMLTLLTGAR